MKDKLIKDTAERFKEENGNSKIDNNDLLIYIMTRIDSLPCKPHLKTITKIDTRQKMTMWLVGIGLSVIGLLYIVV